MERRLGRFLRRLGKSEGKKEIKVIIDGENLVKSLVQMGREDNDLLVIIGNLKRFLEEGEVIGEIYFFATHRVGDRQQEALSKRLRRKGVKVVLKPEKMIIQGMTRKSRIDAWITTEIMATIIANVTKRRRFGKIFLFSGDSDFEAPLRAAKKRGIQPTVISHKNNLSRELRTVASQTISLEKLLDASQ